MPEEKDDLPSLEALSRKIEQAKPPSTHTSSASSGSYLGYAMRFTVDLFAGLLVGALMGYGVDYGLGTTPWAMLAGVFLGVAAGMRNMMRSVKEMENAQGE